MPPAFEPRLPPMVQVPSGGRAKAGTGDRACSPLPVHSASTTPASRMVMKSAGASTSRILFIRRRARAARRRRTKICAPTRPVLPPCGTMAVQVSCASFRIARLLHRSRLQHERGAALVKIARLLQVQLHVAAHGERVFFADDPGKAAQQFGVEAGLVEHVITVVQFPMVVIADGALDQCIFRKAI